MCVKEFEEMNQGMSYTSAQASQRSHSCSWWTYIIARAWLALVNNGRVSMMHSVPSRFLDRSHPGTQLTISNFSLSRAQVIVHPLSRPGQLICKHLSRQPKEFVYELCTKPVSKLIEYSEGRVAGDNTEG